MTEPTYYMLVALMAGPLHGYAIIKRVEDLSDGRITLAAGTLYGALDRMVTKGLITVDSEETVNGRPRRYYKIADSGQAMAVAEAERMQTAAAALHRGIKFGPAVA